MRKGLLLNASLKRKGTQLSQAEELYGDHLINKNERDNYDIVIS